MSAAIALGAVAFLLLTYTPVALHHDTSRHLLATRQCVDLGQCPSIGQGLSFGHLTAFALFSRLLRLFVRHGLSVNQMAGIGIALVPIALDGIGVLPLPPPLRDHVPSDWSLVNDDGHHSVAAYRLHWWVETAAATPCMLSRQGADHCYAPRDRIIDLAELSLQTITEHFDGAIDDDARLALEMPITTDASDPSHVVACSSHWMINRIDGVSYTGTLPARRAVIAGGRESTGTLRLELVEGLSDHPMRRIGKPDLWELRERDAVFAEPFSFPYSEID